MKNKVNLIRHLICLCVLCVGFWLSRYVFWGLHGMKQWPLALFYSGVFCMLISFCAKGRLTPVGIAFGYLVGFVAGLLFESNGTDPGGGTTSNLWIIWGLVYLAVIAMGIVIDMARKRIAR